MSQQAEPPFRELGWMPVDLDVEHRADGTIVLASNIGLEECKPHLPAYLRAFAASRPDATWLARRAPDGTWNKISFGQAAARVDALTQALLDLRLPAGRPLAILSGNSLEHALITFAAMQASIPVAPLSPNYSLLSQDFLKIRGMIEKLEPAIYFVQSGRPFQKMIDACIPAGTPIIYCEDAPVASNTLPFADLVATQARDDVLQAIAAIDGDAVAKYMFTSGSTGLPKAVAQSQRGLVAAAVSTVQTFHLSEDKPSVRLDWTPWNHVFGFLNLCLSLLTGGEFYIDDGKPVEPFIHESLRNLRDISTTTYANVPAGFAAILPYLEGDRELAERFFERLEVVSYAGAKLPDDIGARLQKLAIEITGHRIPVSTGYGSTETGPSGSFVHWPTDRVGLIGLPQAGVRMKLLPVGEGRYEVRVRTPALMLGYHQQPEATAQAFDEEGFYCLGDAATLVEPSDITQGLRFAGRIAEEFKLQTGTFVQATMLRSELLLKTAPLLQDLVVCGEDEAFVAVMAWPNVGVARKMTGNDSLDLAAAARSPAIISQVAAALQRHNIECPGASNKVVRFTLLDIPPSIDGGEITDKGSVNPRAVKRNREKVVEALFDREQHGLVIDV